MAELLPLLGSVLPIILKEAPAVIGKVGGFIKDIIDPQKESESVRKAIDIGGDVASAAASELRNKLESENRMLEDENMRLRMENDRSEMPKYIRTIRGSVRKPRYFGIKKRGLSSDLDPRNRIR